MDAQQVVEGRGGINECCAGGITVLYEHGESLKRRLGLVTSFPYLLLYSFFFNDEGKKNGTDDMWHT